MGADGEVVFAQVNVEAPVSWSDRAVTVVASKYFRGHVGYAGREDSVRALVGRVVETIGKWAWEDGYFKDGLDGVGAVEYEERALDLREEFEDALAYLLLSQALAFNTPVWLNVGVDERPQCSACFISGVEDTIDGLLEFAKTEARIFKKGGGSGANLSAIRSSNELLSRGGIASGPVSFMRGFDAFAGVIKSGGRMRRAAKMVCLNADHPDIMDFVVSKQQEEGKARALVAAGYGGGIDGEAYGSVFFQNANHSVRVTDAFMEAVEKDELWCTTGRTTGCVTTEEPARDLWREIVEAAHACGCPGLQFDDETNRWHTSPAGGRINASNPCAEFVFLDDSACNLASLNLRAFQDERGFLDVDRFVAAVDVAILAQDVIVDRSFYPTDRIGANAKRYRPLGLGYANLGAFLMARGLAYDSPEARAVAAGVTALMTGRAYRRSAELARLKGAFAGYNENRGAMLGVIDKHLKALYHVDEVQGDEVEAARDAWVDAHAIGVEYGFRNAQVTLLAPTGTISFMMDCFTADTLVAVADGRNAVSFGELVREGNDVDVYASKNGRTVVRRMRNIRKVRANVALLRVYFDDGSFVRCTPEHQFMLRDGTYRRADELTSGDSLMRFDSVVKGETGSARRKIWMGPNAGGNRYRGKSWVYQYRLSGARLFPGYDARSGGIVHHDNEDSLDDLYENLIYCDGTSAHLRAHWAKKSATERSVILRARQASRSPEERREASRKTHDAQTPDQRRARGLKAVSERSSKEMSDAAKRGWAGISKEDRRARTLRAWETRRGKSAIGRNHKVDYIVPDGVEDVYCGEVEEVRNFAIVTSGGVDPKGGDLSGVVVHNCDTTGLEPDLALQKEKELVGGGTISSMNGSVDAALRVLGYQDETIESALAYFEKRGTFDGSRLNVSHLPVFDCALSDAAGRSISVSGHLGMMAAVQPFLSGAISKTVNLNRDATVEDVAWTYREAHRLGLKAVAIYRDGSKEFQPLAPKKVKADLDLVEGALESLTELSSRPIREKLPEEARTVRHHFDIGGVDGYFHVGLYDDGRVGEIFARVAKEGSTLSGLLDAFATAVSLALQHGTPFELLVRKFSHWSFEPSGFSTDARLGRASSIVDYLFRWLEIRFPGGRDVTSEAPQAAQKASEGRTPPDYPVESDAPLCGDCGAQMRRNGACHVCPVCATTSGCS